MSSQSHSTLKALQSQSFDLLIIGGGATGAGIALDAQLRGLKVALVEKQDFAFGTSSRSTKLIHGGVRYLEQAVMHLDRSQFKLVRQALSERKILSEIAPHLVHWLPLLIPMYRRFEATYYHVGLRMYDWLAGKNLVHRSRVVSRQEAIELCPQLKKGGLKGGVIYYDGQFDDSRMAMSILLTAAQQGAIIANYVEVIDFEKQNGRIVGVKLRNALNQEEWITRAKVVINATGPFTDRLRILDNPKSAPLLRVSSGAHIVISRPSRAPQVGVLIPKTLDKRVLFVLPWLDNLLVGTTDISTQMVDDPKPTEQELAFIQKEYRRYFEEGDSISKLKSSWSGLRPLINESTSKGTAALSRDHAFDESPSGLLSVFGGKWTTYRLMAQDTVDKVLPRFSQQLKPSSTAHFKLFGAQSSLAPIKARLEANHLTEKTVEHLLHTYGDQAMAVLDSSPTERNNLVHPDHPMILAEVYYCVRNERVVRSADFLFRRTRLAFLDKKAAKAAFSKVHEILAQELNWSEEDRKADSLDFSNQLQGPSIPE